MRPRFLLIALAIPSLPAPPLGAEVPKKYQDTVAKGLTWLAGEQHKEGYWSAQAGQYPVAMTGLAGVALLMEGSSYSEGKYASNLRRATSWLIQRSDDKKPYEGLLGDPGNPAHAGRYMFGHGYALLFLARMFGEVDDRKVRDDLKRVLNRAVKFSVEAQYTQGGWFYTARVEGHDSSETAATVVQMHALAEARNAGIAVPRDVLQKGREYLKKATMPKGGVVHLPGRGNPFGGERPALTAAALAAVFNDREFSDPLMKKWLKYCQTAIPSRPHARLGMDEFLHYYYAQAIYRLGDDGWKTMFPDSTQDEQLTWSAYRETHFGFLKATQAKDGSWKSTGEGLGPIYATAVYLTILQLDNTPVRLSR